LKLQKDVQQMTIIDDSAGGIAQTDYYASELNLLAKLYVSYRAAWKTWRVLAPATAKWTSELGAVYRALLARGEWMEGIVLGADTADALEILLDDRQDAPLALFTTMQAVEGMDAVERVDDGVLLVYTYPGRQGDVEQGLRTPVEMARMPARFRRVADLPHVEVD
jgi:hypothetical protein